MRAVRRHCLFNNGDYYNTDDCGYVEYWDFSEANSSLKNRVKAVSTVASICYGNNNLKPNFKLYDKLARESIGLPSSSFEFVPVLLNEDKIARLSYELNNIYRNCNLDLFDCVLNSCRYGYFIYEKSNVYLLTNLRALMYDLEYIKQFGNVKDKNFCNIENDMWLNKDQKEINLLKDNFKVFRVKATIRDFRQIMRHRRASYQELSRRYTTNNKVKFEFRYDLDVVKKIPEIIDSDEQRVKWYEQLIDKGIKAENARDILPVSLYSQAWIGFYPDGFENFIQLRTKSSTQKSVREIATTMRKIITK